MAANTVKIQDGGWFPLAFGVGIFVLLSTWKRGRDLLRKRQTADAIDIKSFVRGIEEIPRAPGTAKWHSTPSVGSHLALAW